MTSSMKLLWLGAIWESVDRAESANGHLLKAQKKKTLGLGFWSSKGYSVFLAPENTPQTK